jgi:hypothetical protein
MQGTSIGFPMKFRGRARYFRIDIVRHDSQRTIQHGFFFSVAPENSIANRNLLQRKKVARVEINRALQVPRGFFEAPLTSLNVAL